MTNINVIYSPYDDKVTNLYNKELELNESLVEIFEKTKVDIDLLCTKYSFNTNSSLLIDSINLALSTTRNIAAIIAHISNTNSNPTHKLFLFKLKLLVSVYIRLKASNDRRDKYKAMKMPYYSFNYLNTAVNTEMAKSILRGYKFNFGLEAINMGRIEVQEITRKFDVQGYPVDKSIDWEESNKFKQSLINDGIPVYNKETCPTGRKWFIYHVEPFIYYINWKISVYSHKYIKFFKFEPTSFINTKNRKSSDLMDNLNVDVEDIISNNKLGFATKLATLLKKDPSYALTYR